jgi:prevent-host-death family protein
MSEHKARIGIRELRQNASQYVRRAEQGETLEVTDRGRPVARLGPLPKEGDVVERLVSEGKLTRGTGDLLEIAKPAPPIPGQPAIAEMLDELREERFP